MDDIFAFALNKLKIFNDPVYGFISIPYELVFDLIQHPYFQRLRYIKQLGLTHLVYPGALHTRFHHALGAMHLMGQALEILRGKGIEITQEEAEAVTIAILLHDIGHGPFSHALEHSLITEVDHEQLSLWMMEELNEEFGGRLSLAIEIFAKKHPRKFLCQLVSSQLDMDRMDYLNRDSFYTGVSEGVIGFDRILKMLTVADNELVVEEKGIYSIEKFLIARRLMYWQVYYHKTVVVAEQMLVKILERAKHLAAKGEGLFCTEALRLFLYNHVSAKDFQRDKNYLHTFARLDDSDLHTAIKEWQGHSDPILSKLCKGLMQRQLMSIELQKDPFSESSLATHNKGLSEEEKRYFAFTGEIRNIAYNPIDGKIHLWMKDKGKTDIAEASDNLNLTALSKTVKKYYYCYSA